MHAPTRLTTLREHEHGGCVPHVVLDDLGDPVGRITLTNIVRGSFQSCHVGYWVSRSHQRRGLASAAAAEMVRIAGRWQAHVLHQVVDRSAG